MASLPLGLLKATKGTTELTPSVIGGPQGKTWQGLKDVIGGGLQMIQEPAAFVAPEESQLSKEGLLSDVAEGVTNAGTKAVTKAVTAATNVKNLVRPPEEVEAQVTKDAIKHVLGSKADADVIDEAADRIGKTKLFSTVENELKLVKPQVDAELTAANAELDKVLANSSARVQSAGTQLHKVFDDLIQNARAGVGDSSEAEKAINTVRDRVLPKIGDGDLSVQETNNLKRLVGDEIKKFQPPDMLNTAGKNEQEAYRQAYFKLRDLVSEAEPATKDLNNKISNGIRLQDLLERKFPQLETPEAARASYQGVRSEAAKTFVKKATIGTGVAGLTEEVARRGINKAVQAAKSKND
jgi:hypothetical protein